MNDEQLITCNESYFWKINKPFKHTKIKLVFNLKQRIQLIAKLLLNSSVIFTIEDE